MKCNVLLKCFALLLMATVVSCAPSIPGIPSVPEPDSFLKNIAMAVGENLAKAETITLLPWMNDSSDVPDEFEMQFVDEIAKRITAGELTGGRSPKVVVHRNREEAKAAPLSDITIFTDIPEHQLEIETKPDSARFIKKFKVTSRLETRDTKYLSWTTFMNISGKSYPPASSKDTPKAKAEEKEEKKPDQKQEAQGILPTEPYSDDPKERMQQFLNECLLSWMTAFKAQLDKGKQ